MGGGKLESALGAHPLRPEMAASASAALSIYRWNEHARHDMIQSAWMTNHGIYFHARNFAHAHALRACVFSARVCLICMCAHALYFV